MKRFSSIVGRLAISIVIMLWLFYSSLPAINIRSQGFFSYVISCIIIFLVVNFLSYVKVFLESLSTGGFGMFRDPESGQYVFGKKDPYGDPDYSHLNIGKPLKYGLITIAVLIVFMFLASIAGHELFHASRYRDLIIMTDSDFTTDVAEINMSQIPVVDRDTASRLGSRKLGEMTDLVSQFEIENDYTQINYQGVPYRVTPLSYADPIKWLYNQSNGLPAYIMVNMVNQETDLVWLDEGMKYSPSEYFFRNIYRHARFSYPTKMFESAIFEIDDEGTPYWILPTITYRIAWWDGKDIDGAILVNAITGESDYYEKDDIPSWIDQIYSSDLIMNQLDDNGLYQNGYFNSIFGQRNVRRTTYGYNYLAIDNDVYLYTGLSSVTADESNIGFVLVNLRTKETKLFSVPGATETSAMASAQGQVQHLNYTATFPLLLNIANRPTYFISLKDAAGLVKMYAFVDVNQYQLVGTGNTVDEAMINYATVLNIEDSDSEVPATIEEISGTIEAIADVVIDGNTTYYFTLAGSDTIYIAPITLNTILPFLEANDEITFTFTQENGQYLVLELF